MRLLDDKGGVIAEAVVGKKRSDAFGFGKGGTYVRKPGDAQTWLANAELDASADLKDWMKTDVFQVDSSKVSRVTIEIPGEQPLKVERGADKKLALVGIPAGPEVEGRGRRRCHRARGRQHRLRGRAQAAGRRRRRKDASTVKLETDGGLAVTLRLRKEGEGNWLTVDGRRRRRRQEDRRRDQRAHAGLGVQDRARARPTPSSSAAADLLEKIPDPKPEAQKP